MSVERAAVLVAAVSSGLAGLGYLGRRLRRVTKLVKAAWLRLDRFLAEWFGRDADEHTGAPKVPGIPERVGGLEQSHDELAAGIRAIKAKLENGMSTAVETLTADMTSVKSTVQNLQETTVRVADDLATQTARTEERLEKIEEQVETLIEQRQLVNDPSFYRELERHGIDRRHPHDDDDEGSGVGT